MRYGFKARAERMSVAARQDIGLGPIDPIDCHRYVAHLGLILLVFDELTELSADSRRQLLDTDPESWSGMTLKEGDRTALLVNPTHTSGRQRNTMMHEIAHILLDHVPTRVDIGPGGILLVGEYAEDDEGEADWLAGALLLPRDALMACRASGRTNAQIAKLYGASLDLVEWRVRMTGVDIQRRRAASR